MGWREENDSLYIHYNKGRFKVKNRRLWLSWGRILVVDMRPGENLCNRMVTGWVGWIRGIFFANLKLLLFERLE